MSLNGFSTVEAVVIWYVCDVLVNENGVALNETAIYWNKKK